MTDVISMNGEAVSDPRTPNQQTVSMLRDLLDRAESGEIVGVAVASYYWDGGVVTEKAGHYGAYSMIGALQSMAVRIHNESLE